MSVSILRFCTLLAFSVIGIIQAQNLSAKNPFIELARVEKFATVTCKNIFDSNLINELKWKKSIYPPDFRLLTGTHNHMETMQHELFCNVVHAESCINNQLLNPLIQKSTHTPTWIEKLNEKKEELVRLDSGILHFLHETHFTDSLLDSREILTLEILYLEAKILGSQPDFFSKADQARIKDEIDQSIFRATLSIEALKDKVTDFGAQLTRLKPKN